MFLNLGEDLLQTIVVFFSWCCAVLFFGVGIFLSFYRASWRKGQLSRIKMNMRNDAPYYLNKSPKNRSRRIIEDGMKKNDSRIKDPPQFNRAVPPIVANGRDSREDCFQILAKIRGSLRTSHGRNADLMSMRSCLACVEGTWPVEEGERFLRIYEKIVFGIFREGCTQVSTEEIQFMKLFFYHKVVQEL